MPHSDPAAAKAYFHAYYLKRREAYIAKAAAWREANLDKARVNSRNAAHAYRLRNHDLVREREREIYAASPAERWQEKRRKYTASHPHYHRDRNRRMKTKNIVLYLLRLAKERAQRKGIEFSLTPEDIAIPAHCPVLGIPLSTTNTTRGDDSVSLDRVDPSKGYIKGNVKVISWRANHLKNSATLDEVRAILRYMEANIAVTPR